MKKKSINLQNPKLNLHKETVSRLNPGQQFMIEGGKAIAVTLVTCEINASGSGCDCQNYTCSKGACDASGSGCDCQHLTCTKGAC